MSVLRALVQNLLPSFLSTAAFIRTIIVPLIGPTMSLTLGFPRHCGKLPILVTSWGGCVHVSVLLMRRWRDPVEWSGSAGESRKQMVGSDLWPGFDGFQSPVLHYSGNLWVGHDETCRPCAPMSQVTQAFALFHFLKRAKGRPSLKCVECVRRQFSTCPEVPTLTRKFSEGKVNK